MKYALLIYGASGARPDVGPAADSVFDDWVAYTLGQSHLNSLWCQSVPH